MNSLISFFKSIGLLLIVSFIMAVFSILTKNQVVAYFFTYFTSSLIFLFIYKDKLKNDLKNIRNDLNTKNIIVIVLFLVLSFISNIILVNMLNQEANNQEIAVSMLKSFPLLGIPAICLFAPFVEEIIYRLPYKKKLVKHNYFNHCFYIRTYFKLFFNSNVFSYSLPILKHIF